MTLRLVLRADKLEGCGSNYSPNGGNAAQVWGAPLRWGCALIAYRADKLERWGSAAPRDWAGLLSPRLTGRLAMPDAPREFVAVGLASMGLGLNAGPADMRAAGVSVSDARARLKQLRDQVYGLHSWGLEVVGRSCVLCCAEGEA